MKILIHSNGPMVPSGYGNQVKLLAPRLKKAGHDVAVSAFYGLSGSAITWEGIPILPAGEAPYGTDVIAEHARNQGADVVITLMDFWKMGPAADALREIQTLAWLPVDCTPLGRPDSEVLVRSGARPVAMSRFGYTELERAGFPARYAPHMVDTAVFRPPADRRALRREFGLDDFFLVGICAANKDGLRKGFPEQFRAFASFAAMHPKARLMVHSRITGPGGLPLHELAQACGIADKVLWSDQYALSAGLMNDEVMRDWFGCLDVLSACSYGEGFGVPIIEAQACGTPVIATNTSAMPEVTWGGALVNGDPWWNPVHRAWWTRPNVDQITAEYEHLFNGGPDATERAEIARHTAGEYSADAVVARRWLPILAELGDPAPAATAEPEPVDECWCGCNGNVEDHNLAGGRR